MRIQHDVTNIILYNISKVTIMKKIFPTCLLFIFLLFSSCIGVPGYIDNEGYITPPYSKEIVIEAISGGISIVPAETSKGRQNINPTKSDLSKSQINQTVYIMESKSYTYFLEGNHSIIFSFRTLYDEARFTITYLGKTTEYVIHSSDLSDKFVYIENY